MIRFPKILSLLCALLIGALSLSRVSPDLHSSLFHGDGQCAHAEGKKGCGTDKSQEDQKGEEESSCAVVLFGQGLEIQTNFHISTFNELSSNVEFSSVHLIWTTCKYAPFGARDPPVFESV